MLNLYKKSILVAVLTTLTCFTSANATPNQPVQINVNNNIERFTVDPNNGYVVFNEFDSANQLQRYTTKIDGQSSPVQIGFNVNETLNGVQFSIAPNNSRITSRLDNPITGDRDFLSVSINGDESTLLRPAAPITGDVSSNSTSSGNNILAFIINGGGLFSVPNDGSSPAINLSGPIDQTGNVDVGRIRRTQDGNIVVFDAELDSTRQQALFSVPIDGSANPTRLTPLTDIDVTVIRNFTISDDQSTLVYVQENGPGFDFLEQQIFSVPVDGSSDPIALTNVISDFIFSRIDFTVSPDGSHVVYSIPNFSSGITQLFRVATDGQSDPVLIDEGLEVHQVEITNDNRYIIYSITQTLFGTLSSDDVSVLYRAELTSTPNNEPIILSFVNDNPFDIFTSGPLENPINTNIDFVITQDSNFVFFVQNPRTNSIGAGNSLSRASISNPADMPTTIVSSNESDSIFLGSAISSILDFKLSNDESFITYLFETSMPFVSNSALPPHQLSKVDINGSNNQLLPTSGLGDVSEFEISNNDEYVVFTAGFQSDEEDSNNNFSNLYSLSLSNTIVEALCFPIKAQSGDFVTICL